MLLAIYDPNRHISNILEILIEKSNPGDKLMRLQLALNVTDLEAAIAYYQRLFGVDVAKRKPGYANFEVDQPALKLVLFETADATEALNHLGVEMFADADVLLAAERQRAAGLEVEVQAGEGCCFAKQNKAVSYAPDGTMWEWYRKLEDLEDFATNELVPDAKPTVCC